MRVANGAVRCGSCGTVFSAISGLRQDSDEERSANDDAALSPTMQTRELAGIDEIDSPAVSADDDEATPQTVLANETSAAEDAATPASDRPEPTPVPEDHSKTRAAAGDDALDSEADAPSEAEPDDDGDVPEAPPAALEPDAASPPRESAEELHFDPPADDWAVLLDEIEHGADTQAVPEPPEEADGPEPSEPAEATWAPEAFELPPAAGGPELESAPVDYIDVGDPAAEPSWSAIETRDEDEEPYEHIIVDMSEPDDGEAPRSGDDAPSEHDALAAREDDSGISPEEIDATLAAEPDAELFAALGAAEPPDDEVGGSRRWGIGAVVLAVVLGVQIVHHFRAALATQSVVGPIVQGTYGALGVEVVPEWDLEQYEIFNWVATEADAGHLRITAQIRNNGPRTQPYPRVHLELKDRWQAVVGNRVFEPSEYLAEDVDPSQLMAAGQAVPADLAVVDPGEDAYGFELDVCLADATGRLSCAADRVFR